MIDHVLPTALVTGADRGFGFCITRRLARAGWLVFAGRVLPDYALLDRLCGEFPEAGTQAAGYVRQIGKGRFCALTPGHNLAVYENESCLKLLKQALRWCAGE